MTKVFFVTYDLMGNDTDRYVSFFEALTKFSGWWHYLNETWLIATDLTAAQLYHRLSEHLDERVHILVMETGREFAGWLPKTAWEWIRKYQTNEVHTQNGVANAATAPTT